MQFSHVNVFYVSVDSVGRRRREATRRGKRNRRNEREEKENDRYRIKSRLVERLRFVFLLVSSLQQPLLSFRLRFLGPKMLLSIAFCFLLWAWTFRLNSVLSLFANLSEKMYRFALISLFRAPGQRGRGEWGAPKVSSFKTQTALRVCFMGFFVASLMSLLLNAKSHSCKKQLIRSQSSRLINAKHTRRIRHKQNDAKMAWWCYVNRKFIETKTPGKSPM